uniref:Baseplate protein J-like domain-containing protein n=1 Tax=uncultured bacterium contig00055 TaxID=1181539 RepID=A0A806KJW5_9BACT|nr:hypothetical protein [uncultured bacterium contig00055]
MKYGLTEKGFVKPSFPVIHEEVKDLYRASFGSDIDLSEDSPEGAFCANLGMKIFQLWEVIEGLYLAGDPDTAEGVYLDRLGAFVNVERLEALSTRVFTALWGDEGAEILAGHLGKSINKDLFALSKNVTIKRENILGFYFKVKASAAEYLFYIDGEEIAYAAGEDETEEVIQEGLFQALEEAFPEEFARVNQGNAGMVIHSKAGLEPFALFCDDPKIEIVSLGAYGIYLAVDQGPKFVPIGGLNTVVKKTDGLEKIINYATGITGRNAESDNEYRVEMKSRQKKAKGSEIAIENALKELPGIKYARVYSNRSMETVDGIPPKSFESVVEGGDDKEVAETIFKSGPGGIEAFGSTEITVYDSKGGPWPIGFTRPQPRYIWMIIEYVKNNKEVFPINGAELIKENVEAWGDKNLGVGVDFIYQRIDKPIYEVQGISYAHRTFAVTNTLTPPNVNDYKEENIAIQRRQIGIIDRSRIQVREANG